VRPRVPFQLILLCKASIAFGASERFFTAVRPQVLF